MKDVLGMHGSDSHGDLKEGPAHKFFTKASMVIKLVIQGPAFHVLQEDPDSAFPIVNSFKFNEVFAI